MHSAPIAHLLYHRRLPVVSLRNAVNRSPFSMNLPSADMKHLASLVSDWFCTHRVELNASKTRLQNSAHSVIMSVWLSVWLAPRNCTMLPSRQDFSSTTSRWNSACCWGVACVGKIFTATGCTPWLSALYTYAIHQLQPLRAVVHNMPALKALTNDGTIIIIIIIISIRGHRCQQRAA
jgi:hypothetical protein